MTESTDKLVEGTQTVIPEATPALEVQKQEPKPEVKKEPQASEFQPKAESPFPEEAQKRIYELHKENTARRHQNKELEARIAAIEDAKKKELEGRLIKEGKLQELLDVKDKELKELSRLKPEIENYRKSFQLQLDAVLEKLTLTQREMIEESGWELSKKFQVATMLFDERKLQSGGPDSARPGGDTTNHNINLADYSGPHGRAKLAKLRVTNPKMADLVMQLKAKS